MQQPETSDDRFIIIEDCEEELGTSVHSNDVENSYVSFNRTEQKGLLDFLSDKLQTEHCLNLLCDSLWATVVEQGFTDKPASIVRKYVICDLLPNLKSLPESIITSKNKALLVQSVDEHATRDAKEHDDYFKKFKANIKHNMEKKRAREERRLVQRQARLSRTPLVSPTLPTIATTSSVKSADGEEAIDDDAEDMRQRLRPSTRRQSMNTKSRSPSLTPPRRRRHKHTDEHKRAILRFLAEQLRKKGLIEWKGKEVWNRAEAERVTELSWQGMRALALKIVPKLNELSEDVLPLDVKEMLDRRLHLRSFAKRKPATATSRKSEVYRKRVVHRELKKVRKEIAAIDGLDCTASSLGSTIDESPPTHPRPAKHKIPPSADVATTSTNLKGRTDRIIDAFSSVPFGTSAFDAAIYQGVFTENLMPPAQLPMFFQSLETLLELSREYDVGLEELSRLAEQHGNVDAVWRAIANKEL